MPATRDPLPLAARLGFTLWIVVWVPIILATYGAQNFWWLCNLAQFILLYTVWRPNALLLSSQAGTVVFIGIVWVLDVSVGLAAGDSVTGATAYMFDDEIPLIARVTSLYHAWLPLFVLWLCWRIGYDGRGVWLQCIIGTLVIFGARFASDGERNINFAFEPLLVDLGGMPVLLYLGLLALVTALLVYVPGHLLVRAVLARLPSASHRRAGAADAH